MDIFYKIVLSIAIIMLIVILIVVGAAVQNANTEEAYPPTALKCPDYWMDASGGCVSNGVNLGTYTSDQTIDFTSNTWTQESNANQDGSIDYSGLSETCAKKKWANTYEVLWDGISNYNSC